MSIINDALKKAGKSNQMFNKPKGGKKEMKKTSLKGWSVWIGLGAICFLAIFLSTKPTQQPLDSALVAQKPASEAKPVPIVFPLRAIEMEKPLRKSSEFSLSGILYDQDRPMAIINGHVVAEGALISGAQLLEIKPNFVRLSLKNKEFNLTVK